MKAAYLLKPGRISLRDVPDPVPDAGELVLRVETALTCGTTLKAYQRGHSKIPMPGPFGHEYAGTVSLVGPGVTGFSPGDRLVCLHTAPCDNCRYCKRGQTHLCESFDKHLLLGAFAEKIKVTENIARHYAFPLPDSISFKKAAFLQSVSCVVHALNLLKPQVSESLCILGTGSFAVLFALVAQARHLDPVLFGRKEIKCKALEHFGFKATCDPAMLPDLLKEPKPRLVVEAAGTTQAWQQAVEQVDSGGRVLWFGGLSSDAEVTFDHHKVHYKEIQLINSFHYTPSDVTEARDLLFNTLEPEFLLADTFPLQHVEQAFNNMEAGRGLKYAIQP